METKKNLSEQDARLLVAKMTIFDLVKAGYRVVVQHLRTPQQQPEFLVAQRSTMKTDELSILVYTAEKPENPAEALLYAEATEFNTEFTAAVDELPQLAKAVTTDEAMEIIASSVVYKLGK